MKTSVYLGCVLAGRHLVTLLLWSVGVECWSGAQLSYSAVISLQASWAGLAGRERAARWPGQSGRERGRAGTGQGRPALRTRLLSHNCVELDRSQSQLRPNNRGPALHHECRIQEEAKNGMDC